jgi:hypothetical protein
MRLMAGASIDVTCNVKADVGYRFLHVGGGDMFGYNEAAARAATRASTFTKPASAPATCSAAAQTAPLRTAKFRCSSRLQVSLLKTQHDLFESRPTGRLFAFPTHVGSRRTRRACVKKSSARDTSPLTMTGVIYIHGGGTPSPTRAIYLEG